MGLQEYTSNAGNFTALVTGVHAVILISGGGGANGNSMMQQFASLDEVKRYMGDWKEKKTGQRLMTAD